MVTEEAVTIREYRFRLVQNCKNAVKCRLLPRRPYPHWEGDTPFQTHPFDAFGVSARRLRHLVPSLKIPGYAPGCND